MKLKLKWNPHPLISKRLFYLVVDNNYMCYKYLIRIRKRF